MKTSARFGVRRVVAVYNFDPIQMGDGPSLSLRLEIEEQLGSSGEFSAHIFRREHLRVLPSFSVRDGTPPEVADEIILVEDVQDFWDSICGTTAEEVLAQVLEELRGRFGVES